LRRCSASETFLVFVEIQMKSLKKIWNVGLCWNSNEIFKEDFKCRFMLKFNETLRYFKNLLFDTSNRIQMF
jgi:hypothetical protein